MLKAWSNHNYGILLTSLVLSLSACNKIEAPAVTANNYTTTSTATTSASCTDLSEYSTLVACQTVTGANCTSGLTTFSNGASATCYTPVAGYEACKTTTPTWQYTVYTVQSLTASGYLLNRSLLGCSSDVCVCPPFTPTLLQPSPLTLLLPFVSLPNPCTTTSCGSYLYQGGLSIANIPFTLTNPVVTTPAISADISPTISVGPNVTGLNGFRLTIYSDSACVTSLNSALVSNGAASVNMTVTGGGTKNFYATLTDPTTGLITACADTGLSYFQTTTPALLHPTTVIVPSSTNLSGSTINLNFGNFVSSVGMTYSCNVDNIIDGISEGAAVGATIGSVAGASQFYTDTGLLSWTPSSTAQGAFEFCTTGTNLSGNSPVVCTAVYLINAGTFTLTDSLAATVSGNSAVTNPTIGIAAGTGASLFNYKVYADPSCATTALGSGTLDASGNASVAVTVAGAGTKHFYIQYQNPAVGGGLTSCEDTLKSYYLITAPTLSQPSSLLFPSNEAVAGVAIPPLDFHAIDGTSITYTCGYDRIVDNSVVSGSPCTSLSGATFNSSTGILNWTPPLTAYGPYEFCVTGTGAAGVGNPVCVVVDVIPNTLVSANLIHYFDAQFATSDGGQNQNPNIFWKDLMGGSSGNLINTAGNTSIFTTPVFWTAGGTVLNPNYSAIFNAGPGATPAPDQRWPFVKALHYDTADLGTVNTTTTSNSFTMDMWVKPLGYPLKTVIASLHEDIYSEYDDGSGNLTWNCGLSETYDGSSQACFCNAGNGYGNNPGSPTSVNYGNGIADINGCKANSADNDFPVFGTVQDTDYGYILDFSETGASNYHGIKLGITPKDASSYYFTIFMTTPDGVTTKLDSSLSYSNNSWSHAALFWNQSTKYFTLYVNGVVAAGFQVLSFSYPLPAASREIILGSDKDNKFRFNGQIGLFRMYSGTPDFSLSSKNYGAESTRFSAP